MRSNSSTVSTKDALNVDLKKEKDSLANYVNAKFQVKKYVSMLLNTNISGVTFKDLPPELAAKLPESPANILAKLDTELSTAKKHANFWNNEIEPNLTAIPQAIINFNSKFQNYYNSMYTLLVDLTNQPDPQKRKQLGEYFTALYNKIGDPAEKTGIIKEIVIEIANLKTFNTEVHDDSSNFSARNTDFAAIKKFDEDNIKALDQAIKGIEKAISELDKAITAEAIAAGVSGAIVAAGGAMIYSGGVVKPIIGAILMVIGAIGFAISIAELVSTMQEKTNEEMKKNHDQLEVTALTQQMTSLNTVEGSLGKLVSAASTAAASVQVILNTFTTLRTKLEAVINDLADVQKEIGEIMSPDDMKTAKDQWAQLQTFAESMQNIQQAIASPSDPKHTITVTVQPPAKKSVKAA